MSSHRIVKQTFNDGSERFNIEWQSPLTGHWNLITERNTIELARSTVEHLQGKELVSSEVVE